ncbi:MAG TPA: discoidin domain-containing protein [Sphingobacterium sp.]|nr:discoidin domain-containing protein [Sphingobacterium sp.]
MYIKKYIIAILYSVFLFTACKDEETEIEEIHISGVQNLKATSQADGVSLSWENPPDRKYDRVEILYAVNGEEVKLTRNAEEQYDDIAIELIDTEVYKFFVRAFSSLTQQSALTASVKGRKLTVLAPEDELSAILNTVEISGGDGGVRILWKNPSNIHAFINIEYEGNVLRIDANSLSREYTLSGLDLNRIYTFQVSMIYEEQVSSASKMFSVTTLPAYRKLIYDGSWDITASSTLSGLTPLSLLDDNPLTYWKSATRISSATQYVIVDFKEDRYVSALTFVRKWGDSENSSWDINISTSEDGVNYTEPYAYKNSNTDPRFAVEFNRTVDGEQIYMLPHTHKARFVRIDFVRGSGYALFGDINFYGQ